MNEKNVPIEEREEAMVPQPSADAKNMEKRKKIVKTILIVGVAIVVLYGLFVLLAPETWFQKEMPPIPIDENIKLYPPDWESDIMRDEYYAQMDHRVHYYDVDSGATYSLEEEDLATSAPEIRFFYYYFESIMLGDAETYADFFAQDYDGTYEIPEDFTEQMVYDIYVEPYHSEDENKEVYKVFYKISRNNGTFREDIGEIRGVDVGCDLMFVLRPEGDSFLIEHISRFTRH